MNEYTHVGMLFEKLAFDNYVILKPISLVNCNLQGDKNYDVELYGYLEDMSCYTFDDLSPVIGFALEKEQFDLIEDKKAYFLNIFKYLYLQTYDYDDDKVSVYKLDTFNKEMISVYDDEKKSNVSVNDSAFYDKKSLDDVNLDSISFDSDINYDEEYVDDSVVVNFNLKDVYLYLKERIIGQDKAIRQIISTLNRNYNISNYRNKTNILLIGPSGSGKTEIFRSIAEKINIPITIEDSEQYSAVGYVGASISDMLVKLYNNANGNLELAQRGILVIDEIDKKISKDKDDVSGNRILNSLLSLMEGADFKINVNGSKTNPNYVIFNTNYLTVALLGACSDLITYHKNIGFNNELLVKDSYADIDVDKLRKYGFSSELLRRVSIYTLNELTTYDLVNIMMHSSNSVLKDYLEFARKKNINLKISDDAISKIASLAYSKNIGASGIKSVLNQILNDAFFEAEMDESISGIFIDSDTLSNEPPYKLVKIKK